MKNMIMLGIWGLLVPCVVYPFGDKSTLGARSTALGGTGVASPDLWAVINNPAAMSWMKSASAGISAENRFMMPRLMNSGLAAICPFSFGTAGISLTTFGNQMYRELESGVSFSRKFGPIFSAGIGFGLFRIQAEAGYGNRNLASLQIGATLHPREQFFFGIRFINPYPVKVSSLMGDILSQGVDLGLVWKLSGKCSLFAETGKMAGEPICLRIGTEYWMTPVINIRAGFSGPPFSYSFGAGIKTGKWSWDIASVYHPWLGFTPSVSCQYHFSLEK